MASQTNAQTVAINSSAATVTVIANPSTTAFMYIWELAIVIGGTSNLTFNDGTTALSGAMPMVANGSIFRSNFNRPQFTISPGKSFTITNSGSVSINGWCQYSS